MKTYGVNWFLVWVGLLVFVGPLCAWLDLFLFSHWHSPPATHGVAVSQVACQPLLWTWLYYSAYEKALVDPKALERVRQSLRKNEAARRRPYRRLMGWVVVSVLFCGASTVSRLIYSKPAWLSVAAYSLLVPCSSFVCFWLLDKAIETGEVARRVKEAP